MIEDLKTRLEERIFYSPDGCWYWLGALSSFGHGSMWINHKAVGTHRVSYTVYKGVIPKGMRVCHHCDNPTCVNPDHLFLGTQRDNIMDMFKKGRANRPFGSRHCKSKLTETQVLEIRRKYEWFGNMNTRALAKEYGVSNVLVSNIVTRKIWKHI